MSPLWKCHWKRRWGNETHLVSADGAELLQPVLRVRLLGLPDHSVLHRCPWEEARLGHDGRYVRARCDRRHAADAVVVVALLLDYGWAVYVGSIVSALHPPITPTAVYAELAQPVVGADAQLRGVDRLQGFHRPLHPREAAHGQLHHRHCHSLRKFCFSH